MAFPTEILIQLRKLPLELPDKSNGQLRSWTSSVEVLRKAQHILPKQRRLFKWRPIEE